MKDCFIAPHPTNLDVDLDVDLDRFYPLETGSSLFGVPTKSGKVNQANLKAVQVQVQDQVEVQVQGLVTDRKFLFSMNDASSQGL